MGMPPDLVKKLIRERGWSFVDLAARWDISVFWMSRLVNQPATRPAMYEDAFKGLPLRTEVVVARKTRHVRKRKPRQAWSVLDMFPPKRLFEALDNQVVEEGTLLFVHEVVGTDRNATIRFRLADQAHDPLAEVAVDVDTAQRHLGDLCRDFSP